MGYKLPLLPPKNPVNHPDRMKGIVSFKGKEVKLKPQSLPEREDSELKEIERL